MQEAGIEKLVFSSTAAVYGIPEKIPISEDAATEPINAYGHTKLAVERMAHFQSLTGRLRYAALRYFNACGAGNGNRLGEDHRPESHLIPRAILAALGRLGQMSIFGTDYPTPDGTCLRDYIHVEDLCRAHLLALERLDEQTELVYNLGSGRGYSVREVLEAVRRVSGRNFNYTEAARRPAEPPMLTADPRRAERELGWKRSFDSLDVMVESAWKWHLANPAGYDR
jgi:UDP-glucose 4-epimerase